jgi:hypothetical protein
MRRTTFGRYGAIGLLAMVLLLRLPALAPKDLKAHQARQVPA